MVRVPPVVEQMSTILVGKLPGAPLSAMRRHIFTQEGRRGGENE